jgi:SSS family solute:Na+ symporter
VLSLFPPPHIFDLGVWCFSGFSGLFPLVFAALYWKRTTRIGALASVLVTVATWLILFIRDMAQKSGSGGDELLVFGMMPVALIVAVSALTLMLVSLLTPPPSTATVNKFFPEALKGLPS